MSFSHQYLRATVGPPVEHKLVCIGNALNT